MTRFKKRGFMKAMTLPHLAHVVIIIGSLMTNQQAIAQSLSEVVNQTITTNPDIMVDVYHRLSLDTKVDQARANYQPKVDLNLGIGRERSENISTGSGNKNSLTRRESSLTLSQMLYDGYATKNQVELAQSQVDSAAHRVADTSEQTALRAVDVYLEVQRLQELLALAQENLAAHETFYQQIKLRSDSGVSKKSDAEQASSRLFLAQANLSSAEANLRTANIHFQRVTGAMPTDLEDSLAFPCETHAATIEEAIKLTDLNHPALKSAIADYEATLAKERISGAQFKPNANLDAGMSMNRNLDGVEYKNNDAYAMARLNYNVYHGGADSAKLREAAHQNDESLALVEQVKRKVEESTRLSWNTLDSTQRRLPILKQRYEATVLTRDAYAKQFNIGQRTLLDLLDSESELYTAKSDYVNGRYLERFSNYRLMAGMGNLLSTLGISPRQESKILVNGSVAK